MPFYEYECQACKFYTEVMQKISDAPLARCPSCGKRTLKKLLSAPVFRLKGAGWYETDFKSAQENKRNLVGADTKPAESKPAPPKTAAAGGAAPARNRVSVAGKSARSAAARKPTRASKPKGARRRRR